MLQLLYFGLRVILTDAHASPASASAKCLRPNRDQRIQRLISLSTKSPQTSFYGLLENKHYDSITDRVEYLYCFLNEMESHL
ncbi:hypothetical protein BDZ97DRAFT_1793262 [Flammula alnicola]|nr:hypothetical protein BDZ97DRAFT_1793262 [Flammula alnicola]